MSTTNGGECMWWRKWVLNLLICKAQGANAGRGCHFPTSPKLGHSLQGCVCVFFAFAGAVLMVTGCYLINKNLVFRSVLACWHCWLLWRNLISIHTSHTSVFFGFLTPSTTAVFALSSTMSRMLLSEQKTDLLPCSFECRLSKMFFEWHGVTGITVHC